MENTKIIYFLIGLFSSLSYLVGFISILRKKYQPKLFSRIVWLALSINNLISVLLLSMGMETHILAWVTFLGSALIFIGSLTYLKYDFGLAEKIAAALLLISGLIWITTDIPLLNLFIGLIAHFIGSIPTLVRVIKKPEEENFSFWFFFFLGSVLALLVADTSVIKSYIFVLYFASFDGIMALCTSRKFFIKRV
jgi:hypothetical protein